MVELHLAKVDVEGSNPFARSLLRQSTTKSEPTFAYSIIESWQTIGEGSPPDAGPPMAENLSRVSRDPFARSHLKFLSGRTSLNKAGLFNNPPSASSLLRQSATPQRDDLAGHLLKSALHSQNEVCHPKTSCAFTLLPLGGDPDARGYNLVRSSGLSTGICFMKSTTTLLGSFGQSTENMTFSMPMVLIANISDGMEKLPLVINAMFSQKKILNWLLKRF